MGFYLRHKSFSIWQFVAAPRVEQILLPLPDGSTAETNLLRLDDVHPHLSGNKFFKLLPNLHAAQASGCGGLLTFGGAYSNHIHATAAAGYEMAIATVGIIRAEPSASNNPTLTDAERWGMDLHFVDRTTYRRRHDASYLAHLAKQFPGFWVIPEGGSNPYALEGCRQLGSFISTLAFHHIVLACGTGSTALGISQGVGVDQRVHAVAVLTGLKREQQRLQDAGVVFHNAYVGAGYAVITSALADFIRRFERLNKVSLDPVYTAKMALAASELIASGALAAERTLLVHTGGIQGRRSMQEQLEAFWRNNPACT